MLEARTSGLTSAWNLGVMEADIIMTGGVALDVQGTDSTTMKGGFGNGARFGIGAGVVDDTVEGARLSCGAAEGIVLVMVRLKEKRGLLHHRKPEELKVRLVWLRMWSHEARFGCERS
ncbi:hypothetical protein L1987_00390 [Smallanthus sonchifolius]|uniref:Uncharacterized protein n=1 Tax=Smallanthus sonchifolius TaxID=185202 RepID=A0ACB9K274_9ASTR|nr:hypothetical protein L1987_00390 [Smallanthus sonchifolius]